MITNKDVIEQGKIVQHYSIDHNPFTGKVDEMGGFENLVMYDNKIWSVYTDFTGSVADPMGTPDIVTDDVETFMQTMFFMDESDVEKIIEEEGKALLEYDFDQWELEDSRWDDEWLRDDDW